MHRGERRALLTAGMVMLLMLTACSTPAPPVRSTAPVAKPTATPAFATDAAVLSAAMSFYQRYLDAANDVGEHPSLGAASLKKFLSTAQYKSESADVASLRKRNIHYSGPVFVSRAKSQSLSRTSGAGGLYVCITIDKARLLNSAGADVTPLTRPKKGTLLVQLSGLPGGPLIESSKVWTGSSIC